MYPSKGPRGIRMSGSSGIDLNFGFSIHMLVIDSDEQIIVPLASPWLWQPKQRTGRHTWLTIVRPAWPAKRDRGP